MYLAVKAFPDLDLYKRLEEAGVTDLLCAPWMLAETEDGDTPETLRAKRLDSCPVRRGVHRTDAVVVRPLFGSLTFVQ